SHLVDALLARGDTVVVFDDLSTGTTENLASALTTGRCELRIHDVSKGLECDAPVHEVYHLASPASPPAYLARPLETLAVGSEGTRHALELARRDGAKFLLASTSEVYGDPLEHPQRESYWGNVNPVGPRSVYDEAKRFAEALSTAYRQTHDVPVAIVRIFNTFGPRLAEGDGRVVSNFICQSLRGESITVYGTGEQTRSLCYVSDLVRGLQLACAASYVEPVNLGNPNEMTVFEIAKLILAATRSSSEIVYQPLPQDDPSRRRPDISRATEILGWSPEVDVSTGIAMTVEYFANQLGLR
ncbi:MAG: NAD-dependent epimerase/dehydratase family protein, partial [Actinomycetes bacterium]